jgi:curli biogenesis system outer membrane secretion channel CsgG
MTASLTRTAGLMALVLGLGLSLGAPNALWAQGVVDPVTGQTLAQGRIRLGIAQAQAGKTLADGTKWNRTDISLNRVLESIDSEFRAAMSDTNKFALVARSNLPTILQEQGLTESGNVNANDPVAAQGFKIAGVKYLVIVRMNDFQDQSETRTFEQLGVKATLRNIRIDGQVELVDTTTGGILVTAPFKTEFQGSEDQAVKQGAVKNGNETDVLINQAARQASISAVQAILDKLTPAKAMAVRDGVITFNRNKACGVNVGDLFNVYAQGDAMVDPDTGEKFSEEVLVSRAEVIESNDRFSKARIVQGALVGPGAVLRKAVGPQDKLPLNAPPPGSVPSPQGAAPVSGGGAAQQIVYVPVQVPAGQGAPAGAVAQPGGVPAIPAAEQAPVKKKTAAVFIRNRAANSGVSDDKVSVLEDKIVAKFNSMGVSTISREDTINAVSNFASQGPNKGDIDPKGKALDLILSDNTSALQLARNMGADMILIGAVTGMEKDTRRLNMQGVDTSIDNYTMSVSYRIIDAGGKGNVMASDEAKATESVRQMPGIQVTTTPVDRLLSQTTDKLAAAFGEAVKRGDVQPQQASKEQGQVKITCTIPEMTVPELVKQENGEYKFIEGAYAVSPSDVTVEIDGLAVGSAPGTFNVGPGIHNIRLTRPGFVTTAFRISGPEAGSPPMAFNVAIKMTDKELTRWRENIVLINTLKGLNKLTDAQADQVRGFAQFLRQSHLRIEGAPSLNVGGWGMLWDAYNQTGNQPRPVPAPAPAPAPAPVPAPMQ